MAKILIAALIAIAMPAAAQDGSGEAGQRTRAGAQKFLVLASAGGLPVTNGDVLDYDVAQMSNNRSRVRFVGAHGGNDCVTGYALDVDWDEPEPFPPGYRTYRKHDDSGVAWAFIAKVALMDDRVTLTDNNGRPRMTVRFASPDLATRAAAAFEFLRVGCDKSGDIARETGF